MSNFSYQDDAEILWTSREVVRFFKDKLLALRKEEYKTRSAKNNLGEELLRYFKAVDVRNTALDKRLSAKGTSPAQFLQEVLNGIKPLTNSKQDGNPKGANEGAVFLALLSDQYPDIAKSILKFAAERTLETGCPSETVEFRFFIIDEGQIDGPKELDEDIQPNLSIVDKESGQRKAEEESHQSISTSNIIQKYNSVFVEKPSNELTFVGVFKEEVTPTGFWKHFGFNLRLPNKWSAFAFNNQLQDDFGNFDELDFDLCRVNNYELYVVGLNNGRGGFSYVINEDGTKEGRVDRYDCGYRLGCFFAFGGTYLVTLFDEFTSISSQKPSTGSIVIHESTYPKHGDDVKYIWKPCWQVPVSNDARHATTFRGTDDDKRILYLDRHLFLVLNVMDQEELLRVELDRNLSSFYHACFNKGQSYVAISGFENSSYDNFSRSWKTDYKIFLYDLLNGERISELGIDENTASSFRYSAFGDSSRLLAYLSGKQLVVQNFDSGDILSSFDCSLLSDFSISDELVEPIQFSENDEFILVNGKTQKYLFQIETPEHTKFSPTITIDHQVYELLEESGYLRSLFGLGLSEFILMKMLMKEEDIWKRYVSDHAIRLGLDGCSDALSRELNRDINLLDWWENTDSISYERYYARLASLFLLLRRTQPEYTNLAFMCLKRALIVGDEEQQFINLFMLKLCEIEWLGKELLSEGLLDSIIHPADEVSN